MSNPPCTACLPLVCVKPRKRYSVTTPRLALNVQSGSLAGVTDVCAAAVLTLASKAAMAISGNAYFMVILLGWMVTLSYATFVPVFDLANCLFLAGLQLNPPQCEAACTTVGPGLGDLPGRHQLIQCIAERAPVCLA